MLNSHGFSGFRKDVLESMMIDKRRREAENSNKWQSHSKYLNDTTVKAMKEKKWTSSNIRDASIQAFQTQQAMHDEISNLEHRRETLRKLIEEDADHYKNVLQSRDNNDSFRVNHTDSSNVICPKSREISPVLQEFGSNNHSNQVAVEDVELKRVNAHRIDERKRRLELIQEKLDELHRRELEANTVAAIERELTEIVDKLNNLSTERKLIFQQFEQNPVERVILRHHHAAIRRRTQTLQTELQAELQWLKRLKELVEEKKLKIMDGKLHPENAIDTLFAIFEKELQKERKIEEDLDGLQSHETARLWASRYQSLDAEIKARHIKLSELLDAYRSTVDAQLNVLRREQRGELESRELLLDELEQMKNEHLGEEKELPQTDLSIAQNSKTVSLNNQVQSTNSNSESSVKNQVETAYEKIIKEEAAKLHDYNDKMTKVYASLNSRRPGGNIW